MGRQGLQFRLTGIGRDGLVLPQLFKTVIECLQDRGLQAFEVFGQSALQFGGEEFCGAGDAATVRNCRHTLLGFAGYLSEWLVGV
ncbi:MAG TPA: hypothetical protein DIT89_03160 [Planctomycetaceae bacterium]|nr:hypothetical protein [Planctomycetaceae bacterium]